MQIPCWSKQIKVSLGPMDGIRQSPGRVQYDLPSTESAVTLQKETLTGGRRALVPAKHECRLFRLDVVGQPLCSIVRHLTL